MRVLSTVGRMIVGSYFLYNAYNHFTNTKAMAGYAKSKGVEPSETAVLATGGLMAAGGLGLLTGYQPRVGAALVLLFLAVVTPTMHDFWNDQEPGQRQINMINFAKNIALAGGALTMMGQEG